MSNIIQADYEQLEEIAKRFAQRAEEVATLQQRLTQMVQRVGPGIWQGEAATRFVSEMDTLILPAVKRLGEALDSSARTTTGIAKTLRTAEEEAAALFRGGADGAGGAASTTPSATEAPAAPFTYDRLNELARLRRELAAARTPEDRQRLQDEIDAIEAGLAEDGAAAQEILDQIADADTEAEKDALRAQLRNDEALMEGMIHTLPPDELRSAVTELQVNQPGRIAHSDAATADQLIRAGLPDYVDDSHQVQGDVAIVDDTTWDALTRDMSPTVQGANAFVDSNGNIIIHQDRGNAGTIVHEGVHKYSNDAVRTTVSWNLNEGITEYFSRQVIADMPNGAAINARRVADRIYNDQHAVVTSLVGLVGEETVAGAYFDGDTTQLRDRYLSQSGRSQADWDTFLSHMNSRPPDFAAAQALLTPLPRPTPRPRGVPIPE